MPASAPPFIVTYGSQQPLDEAGSLRAQGWRLSEGFALPHRTWALGGLRLVCVGAVRSQEEAEQALLAASRGVGIVACVELAEAAFGRFLEDLGRLGPVELLREPSDPVARLPSDELRALRILADGGSLAEVAAALNYSRRTVSRRLAAARARLNVASNAEAALMVARRPR